MFPATQGGAARDQTGPGRAPTCAGRAVDVHHDAAVAVGPDERRGERGREGAGRRRRRVAAARPHATHDLAAARPHPARPQRPAQRCDETERRVSWTWLA